MVSFCKLSSDSVNIQEKTEKGEEYGFIFGAWSRNRQKWSAVLKWQIRKNSVQRTKRRGKWCHF